MVTEETSQKCIGPKKILVSLPPPLPLLLFFLYFFFSSSRFITIVLFAIVLSMLTWNYHPYSIKLATCDTNWKQGWFTTCTWLFSSTITRAKNIEVKTSLHQNNGWKIHVLYIQSVPGKSGLFSVRKYTYTKVKDLQYSNNLIYDSQARPLPRDN